MKRVYLAGGWFDPEQEERLSFVEKTLREKAGLDVFSPREHQFEELEMGSREWAKQVYLNDVKNIIDADVVFAIYDKTDSGTMWEIGYAIAIGKPVYIFKETDEFMNLMISESVHGFVYSREELKDFDFDTYKYEPYKGTLI